MPIPVFTSRIVVPDTTPWTVQCQGFSLQTFSSSQYYHLVSSKSTTGNGQSFLYALQALLEASNGVGWSVTFDSNLKVRISHGSASGQNIDMPAALADALGFGQHTTYVNEVPSGMATIPVAIGVPTTAIAPSYWLWCPGMPISGVGPEQFDPAYTSGVRSSAGAALYAPDGTASFVSNGIQVEAEFFFNGVTPYRRAYRPPWSIADLNHDFDTWWKNGPREGRSVLFWRDKSHVINSAAPSSGGPSPYRYVEYFPAPALRERPPIRASVPGNLNYWDISIPLRLTERAEAIY